MYYYYMAVEEGLVLRFFWDRNGADDYRNFQQLTGNHAFNNDEAGTGDTFTSIFTANNIIIAGSKTYQEVLDTIQSFFAGVWQHYWINGNFTKNGVIDIDGADIGSNGTLENYLTDLYSETVAQLKTTSNMTFAFLAKGSHDSSFSGVGEGDPDQHFPSILCNPDSLVTLRWDLVDDIDITFDGGTTWYEVESGITSQAEVATWLEAVYPDDNYLFAYNTTSGIICVDWQDRDVGNGGFEYSVDLEENLNLDDDVKASVARYGVNTDKWL